MKTPGSPSPLDRISIIFFKHFPYLRTYLTELIKVMWLSGTVPEQWKKACKILIHKKHDPNLPENIRPITVIPFVQHIKSEKYQQFAFSYKP